MTTTTIPSVITAGAILAIHLGKYKMLPRGKLVR